MNERRLHPFTVLRFLRKTLVVYLLPLVQVLFERNWTALHTALRHSRGQSKLSLAQSDGLKEFLQQNLPRMYGRHTIKHGIS